MTLRLLNLTTALSLLLCGAAAGLWVWSDGWVGRRGSSWGTGAGTAAVSLLLLVGVLSALAARSECGKQVCRIPPRVGFTRLALPAVTALLLLIFPLTCWLAFAVAVTAAFDPASLRRPFPVVVLTLFGWGSVYLLREWSVYYELRRRIRDGLCPACGYDMRGAPGRCPECGGASSEATE